MNMNMNFFYMNMSVKITILTTDSKIQIFFLKALEGIGLCRRWVAREREGRTGLQVINFQFGETLKKQVNEGFGVLKIPQSSSFIF